MWFSQSRRKTFLASIAAFPFLLACGQKCPEHDCEDSLWIEISDDSTWGQGLHTLTIEVGDSTTSCTLYPYHHGARASCDGAQKDLAVGLNSILLSGKAKAVHVRIEDSEGWIFDEIVEPTYAAGLVELNDCKVDCRRGSAEIVLDGPGTRGAHVDYPYLLDGDWLEKNGAGGAWGGPEDPNDFVGETGSRCSGVEVCDEGLLCRTEFLGERPVCTRNCESDEDCREGRECVSDLYSSTYETLAGRCMLPCDSDEICASGNAVCGIQDAGHFCF